nr:2133_t:CDS:2 [Entrophospora candida]
MWETLSVTHFDVRCTYAVLLAPPPNNNDMGPSASLPVDNDVDDFVVPLVPPLTDDDINSIPKFIFKLLSRTRSDFIVITVIEIHGATIKFGPLSW